MRMIVGCLSAVLVYLAVVSSAHAGWEGYTTANVNMREGPSSRYHIVATIPAGEPVHVLGCLEHRSWCEVEWQWYRGFVFERYLDDGAYSYVPGSVIIIDPYDYPDYVYVERPRYHKHYVPPKRKKKKVYKKKRKKKKHVKPPKRKKRKAKKPSKRRKPVMKKARKKSVKRNKKKQRQHPGMRRKKRR